jgi:hypothetical protein
LFSRAPRTSIAPQLLSVKFSSAAQRFARAAAR